MEMEEIVEQITIMDFYNRLVTSVLDETLTLCRPYFMDEIELLVKKHVMEMQVMRLGCNERKNN